jgi:NAD(P)H dehydrogenase (quinone)
MNPRQEALRWTLTVELDLNKSETFAPALREIERVFLMTGYTVEMLQQSKVFLDVAAQAGVRHVVHLGACGDDEAGQPNYGSSREEEFNGSKFCHSNQRLTFALSDAN